MSRRISYLQQEARRSSEARRRQKPAGCAEPRLHLTPGPALDGRARAVSLRDVTPVATPAPPTPAPQALLRYAVVPEPD